MRKKPRKDRYPTLTPHPDGSFSFAYALTPPTALELPDVRYANDAREVLVPLREDRSASGRLYVLPRGCAPLLERLGLRPRFLLPGVHHVTDFPDAAGALYVGGADLDPLLYGTWCHPKTDATEQRRDVLEILLLRERILPQRLPYLGLCRGAQALAIAAGGTLHQHLPDLGYEEHHWEDPVTAGDAVHPVLVDPVSRCATHIGTPQVIVNSHHHQAIDQPGTGNRIVGRSPCGIAEIIERDDPAHWCVGLQGHPERETRPQLDPVLRAFADAVRAYRPKD